MKGYRLGLYEKAMPNSLTLHEKLCAGRDAGFDFMELSVDETDAKLARLTWSAEERKNLTNIFKDEGIRMETMCLSGHRRFPLGCEDMEKRRRGLEIMREAIKLAADLGIRIIQIAGYDEYYAPSNENTRRLFEEGLRESVAFAAQYGVILAFETMETAFMNTVEKAMRFVTAVGSPYLQVYPDLGNITNAAVAYGTTVPDDLQTGTGHIAAMHLKETVPGVFREVPYGTGHVDFFEGVETALRLGTRLFVGEFWDKGEDDWRERLNAANVFLREKLQNFGGYSHA